MMQSANKTHVPVCPNFKPNYNHRERRKRTPLLGPKRAILSSREFHSESTGVERGPVPVPPQAPLLKCPWVWEEVAERREGLKG